MIEQKNATGGKPVAEVESSDKPFSGFHFSTNGEGSQPEEWDMNTIMEDGRPLDEPSDNTMPELPKSAQLNEGLRASACQWLNEYERFSQLWSPRGWDDFHAAAGGALSTVTHG